MNDSGYYSFLKIEDEADTFYQFITINNIVYTVYFKVDEYSTYVDKYPLLLQQGYAFGFRRQKPEKGSRNIDDKIVFSTIAKIISDFFVEKGNETVLLYHCDASDGKHHNRNRLFNYWEKLGEENNFYDKKSIEVSIPEAETEDYRVIYLGYIISKLNPLASKVNDEFESFAVDLIRPK